MTDRISVVAERTLECQDASNGHNTLVQILFRMPEERLRDNNNEDAQDGGDWSCGFDIVGLGEERRFTVVGSDSLQALYLAMILARRVLETSNAGIEGRLSWHDVPGFGLPEFTIPLSEEAADALRNATPEERSEFSWLIGEDG
jgi:hypothetical protein